MLDFNLRRRARNLVVHTMSGHAVLRALRPSEVYLTPHSELMIEGYPRSGNSFAEAAFLYAQRDCPVSLAHHAHSAGHVLAAITRRLPVLVLYRNPIDAAASFMEECQGALAPAVALWEYHQFHRPLMDRTDHLVLGSFETLIQDFPSLISRINTRFGTTFENFHQTPETVREIRTMVDEISLRRSRFLTRYSGDKAAEEKTARAAILGGYRAELCESPALAAPRKAAISIYNRLQELEARQLGPSDD